MTATAVKEGIRALVCLLSQSGLFLPSRGTCLALGLCDWLVCYQGLREGAPVPLYALRKSFSTQTYSTHYYLKRIVSYRDVLYRLVGGESLRGMSRALGCSLSLLTNRIDRLARQGIALHARMLRARRGKEDICIDGFVSFDCSQYFPSEIPIAVGRTSGFVLDVSHCTRKRSGSMRQDQKAKAQALYSTIRLERGGIGRSFREVLATSLAVQPPQPHRPFVLITDEKPDYARLVRKLAAYWGEGGGRLVHLRISSHLPRTIHNPLFSSNYTDRELRKDLANHHRESVCFNRNVANGMLRLWAYLMWHNYLKPYRIRWPKGRRPATHAEASASMQLRSRTYIEAFSKNGRF